MERMDKRSEGIEQNKHNSAHTDDSTLVITQPRPTYIVPTKPLLAIYPVIALLKDFVKAKFDPAETLIDMSDFHFIEGMDYDAHPLLDVQQTGLRLNDDNSFAEKELAKIQTRLAHFKRPLDTLALMASKDDTENIWKDRAVSLTSTILYLAGQTTLDAINADFPVEKKHNKPFNKDQDKQDSTKSDNSND
ncbi:hypothetical protein BGX30_014450 [Mortierella sp. GBA39]|nr:hypothetical protein BGX30_014450 [Mortierella sp. GBA39]